jgi:hypothetical protein
MDHPRAIHGCDRLLPLHVPQVTLTRTAGRRRHEAVPDSTTRITKAEQPRLRGCLSRAGQRWQMRKRTDAPHVTFKCMATRHTACVLPSRPTHTRIGRVRHQDSQATPRSPTPAGAMRTQVAPLLALVLGAADAPSSHRGDLSAPHHRRTHTHTRERVHKLRCRCGRGRPHASLTHSSSVKV